MKGIGNAFDRLTEARTSTPEEFRAFVRSGPGRAMQQDHGYYLREVAPDVYASASADKRGCLWIDLIECGDPGKGKVGAWLDSLADRHVRVDGVISERLEGMLVRRDYRLVSERRGMWEHKP